MSVPPTAARLGVTLLFVSLAMLAQRWQGWDDGLALGGMDAHSYEAMALAAPALLAPSSEEFPFHHAQRLTGPYVVGVLARFLHMEVREMFAWASGACLLGAILLMHAAMNRLDLSPWALAICMAMIVFHYSFRFYLVAVGMLPDALFILGLTLTLAGLVGVRLSVVLAGVLVAGLARQSVLLLIPGIAYWILRSNAWEERSMAARILGTTAATLIAAAAYIGTGLVAEKFAGPSTNLESVTGFFSWLAGPDFSLEDLAIFVCYAAFPLMIPSAMLVADLWYAPRGGIGVRWSIEIAACLLMAATIVSQPLLGGPDYPQNGNAMRLAALAFAPLALAVAMRLREFGRTSILASRALPVILLLGAGSLHYNYTLAGPRTQAEFAFVELAVAVLSAWWLFRRPAPRT